MTTPGPARDPGMRLHADVAGYISAMRAAQSATTSMARRAVADLRSVEEQIRRNERAARDYDTAARRRGATGAGGSSGAGGGIDDIYNAAAARRARDRAAADRAAARSARDREAADRAAAAAAAARAREEEANARRRQQAYDDVGRTAAVSFAVITAGFLATAHAAMQWESDFAGVTKTVGGTDRQLADLNDELREMARTMPATHHEIAAVAEAAGALGVARENITAFTRVAVELGVSTNMSAEEASTGLAKLMNIMGSAPSEIGRYGAALVDLGNNGASTERDILEVSLRLAGAAKTAGIGAADVLGFGNALASLGINAELGGGALSRIMLRASNAVQVGGRSLQAFADLARKGGLREGFAQAFGAEPQKALVAVVGGLKQVRAEGGNTVAALNSIGAKGVYDRDVLNRLTGGFDTLTESMQRAPVAWSRNVALMEEANKRFATTASAVQIARNRLHDAAITAGDVLLPAIGAAADQVGDLGDAFRALPGWAQDTVVGLGSTAGALGLLGAVALVTVGRFRALQAAIAASGITPAGFRRLTVGLGALVVGLYGVTRAADAMGSSLDRAFNRDLRPNALLEDLVTLGQGGGVGPELSRAWGPDLENLGEWMDLAGAKTRRLREDLRQGFDVGPIHLGSGIDELYEKIAGAKGVNVVRTLREQAGAVDAMLAAMQMHGGTDQAAAAFDRLAGAALEHGASMQQLRELFPQYRQELQRAAVDEGMAAAGIGDLGDAADAAAAQISDAGINLKDFNAAVDALMENAFGLSGAEGELQTQINALGEKSRTAAAGIDALRAAAGDAADATEAGGAAADAYEAKLAAMRDTARDDAQAINDLRAAVDDELSEAFAGRRAADALAAGFNDLAGSAADSAGEISAVSSAIDAMLSKAFSADEAVDAFNAKVAEIKQAIREAPGNGIRLDLGLEGDTDSARKNRADVRDLAAREAALIKEDVRLGADPTVATAARTREFEEQLTAIGYATEQTASYVDALRGVPAALEEAARAGRTAGEVTSRAMEGSTKAAIDNRAKVMALVAAEAEVIKGQVRPGMTQGQARALVEPSKAELSARLTDAGYDPQEIAPYVAELDRIPAALAAAGAATKAASKTLEGNSRAALTNRAAVRELVDLTEESVKQDLRVGMSKREVAAVVARHTQRLNDDLAAMGYSAREAAPLLAGLARMPAAYASAAAGIDVWTATLSGNSQVAVDNKKALAGIVTQAALVVEQFAATGASADEVSAKARVLHDRLVEQFVQFGFTRAAAARYARVLLEIPGAVATNVTATTGDAKRKVGEVAKSYSTVKDFIENNPAKVDVAPARNRWLQWAYDGIDALRGWVSANPISMLFRAVDAVTGAVPDWLKFAPGLGVAGGSLLSWGAKKLTGHADGGYVHGPGGPRDDKVLRRLSNGEFVVNAAETRRHRGLLEDVNAGRYRPTAGGRPAAVAAPMDRARMHAWAPPATVTVPALDYDRLGKAVASAIGAARLGDQMARALDGAAVNIDGARVGRVTGRQADLLSRGR